MGKQEQNRSHWHMKDAVQETLGARKAQVHMKHETRETRGM